MYCDSSSEDDIFRPEKLPPNSTGLSPLSFKVWKSKLIFYIKQDEQYRRFLPGGIYQKWIASENEVNRIRSLHADDTPGNQDLHADDTPSKQAQHADDTVRDTLGNLSLHADDTPANQALNADDTPSKQAMNADDTPSNQALHADDTPSRQSLQADDTPSKQDVVKDNLNETLLKERRRQLQTLLVIIAQFCHDSHDFMAILRCSTSVEWIFKHIEQVYGIEKRGVNFMKLNSIKYDKTSGETHMAFYRRFRQHFMDNLREKGDVVQWKGDQPLKEDEKMSPTLECSIVFFALKEIDHRLPERVEQVFCHQMFENLTIRDIQPQVFQAIPHLLDQIEAKDAHDAALRATNYYRASKQRGGRAHNRLE